ACTALHRLSSARLAEPGGHRDAHVSRRARAPLTDQSKYRHLPDPLQHASREQSDPVPARYRRKPTYSIAAAQALVAAAYPPLRSDKSDSSVARVGPETE